MDYPSKSYLFLEINTYSGPYFLNTKYYHFVIMLSLQMKIVLDNHIFDSSSVSMATVYDDDPAFFRLFFDFFAGLLSLNFSCASLIYRC